MAEDNKAAFKELKQQAKAKMELRVEPKEDGFSELSITGTLPSALADHLVYQHLSPAIQDCFDEFGVGGMYQRQVIEKDGSVSEEVTEAFGAGSAPIDKSKVN
jgi:hypothetical protein